MRYKLYLDDQRHIPDMNPDWRLARSYHDAIWYVTHYGLPYHISFDHDLADVHYGNPDYGHSDGWMTGEVKEGEIKLISSGYGRPYEYTGYDFAKWFCRWVMDNEVDLTDFDYNVHSANPVGAENIRRYMESFLRDRYV